MSVKDLNKRIIVTDSINGEVLFSYDPEMFTSDTQVGIITNLYFDYVLGCEHGLLIKVGYKP